MWAPTTGLAESAYSLGALHAATYSNPELYSHLSYDAWAATQRFLVPPKHGMLPGRQHANMVQQPQLQQVNPMLGWGGQSIPSSVPQGQGQGFERAEANSKQSKGRGGSSSRGRGARRPGRRIGVHDSDSPVEELVWRVKRLPVGEPVSSVAENALMSLDSRTTAAVLKELSKSMLYHRACELFDWLRKLDDTHALGQLCDVFTYTAMIALCVPERELDRALELMAEMREKRIERNVHTYSALMNVCIKCGQLQLALDVYQEMQRENTPPNVVTYNTLIDVYGKTGQWAEALKVVEKMKREGLDPVTRTFNTLMIACNTSGQWHEALAVYGRMMEAGHTPNTTTYNALISAYSKAGRLEKVMETFQQMVAQGCERSVITYSALISACEKAGQWELALQLFSEMQREGCTPNVITYNSLITACAQGAQWERAAEVFARMQRQGCTPDVVTYTALIGAYERGGQWRRALQAFEQMQQQGCEPDSIVFNAIIDALWDTGVVWAQRKAVLLLRFGAKEGLFRRPPTSTSMIDCLELNLQSHTSGVAMAMLYVWLTDLRERVMRDGVDCLPSKVAISTGRGRQRDHQSVSSATRDAIMAVLQQHRSPFPTNSETQQTGRMEASGAEVGEWLGTNDMALFLAAYLRKQEPHEADRDLGRELAMEGRCSEAFTTVKHFENTHCLNVQAMGYSYLQARDEYVHRTLQLAAKLGVKSELAHDAVLLMDRTMSTHMAVKDSQLPLAAAICLIIILKQQDKVMSDEELARSTGFSAAQLSSMEMSIRLALTNDTASISALRCLNLYLERIGSDFMQDLSGVEQDGVSAFSLVHAALLDREFLNYRPSVVAAAALYCDRLTHGLLPFWPSSLAVLTGYSNAHTPELAAAITGAHRLVKQLQFGGVKASLLTASTSSSSS